MKKKITPKAVVEITIITINWPQLKTQISFPLPREKRRSQLRRCEQRRHIWRQKQTSHVIQMIIINDTIFLCTTTIAWSNPKMSREAFSGAKVPEVYDDSVATTLKVIMDVLKVKSFPRKLYSHYVRPVLFYMIIITTITFSGHCW